MTSQGRDAALGRLLRGEPPDPTTDWEFLARYAAGQRIAPLLYQSLCKYDRWRDVPAEAGARLQRAYRRTRMENALRVEILRETLARLGAAGIPAAPLKGAALAEWIYDDPGVRPMTDLDLLVPPEQAARSTELLLDAGFRRMVVEIRPGFDGEFRGEVELQAPGQVPYCVELHWRLIDRQWIDRHVDYDGLWQRAEATPWHGEGSYRLGMEDWLLYQAAHATYKHRRATMLDLCDLDRLARHAGAALDWERLMRLGQETRWLPSLAALLERARALLETPVPSEFLRRAAAYRLPAPERWLARAWLSGGLADSAFPLLDWLTLPSVGARLRFAGSYLFPSRDFLRACYPQAAGWPAAALHARRWWDRTAGLVLRGRKLALPEG